MTNPLKVINTESAPWYKEGLSFSCTGCGKCCTGSPGYVWVSDEEIEAIASHLKITFKECTKKYLRRVHGKWSLIEKKKTYDCVFLRDNACILYSARPVQCRTYPFWPEIIKSKETWEDAARECEGIREDNPVIPLVEIEKNLHS